MPSVADRSPAVSGSPPRAPPIKYEARHGTRWQKEKAAAGAGAFEYPEDAKYVGPWIIGECVGKGASGHVKIAKHRKTGQLAAVKILPLDFVFSSRTSLRTQQAKSDKQRLGIDREIIMMKLMNHPNIMRIYDVYEGENELYLILEYVEGGELFDFLVNRGRLASAEALAYFKQIIYGLNYAHAFSIIHRDLKPENILIHSLNPPLVKIADWGMAAFAPPSLELETSCGSPHYASPEIVHGHKYEGTATDIWSCGVILFALLTGRLPFDDKNVRTLLSKVKAGKYDLPIWVDAQARDLVNRMLVVDVHKRITIPEILAHPWFANPTPGINYVPAPSVTELARPLRSFAHVDIDVFSSLCIIWGRHADSDAIKRDLLSPAGQGTLAKAFYFLLLKHREQTFQDSGIIMDVDEAFCDVMANVGGGAMGRGRVAKKITKLYITPLSAKKVRPLTMDVVGGGGSGAFKLAPPPLLRTNTAPAPSTASRASTNAPAPESPRRSRGPSPSGPRTHRTRPTSSPVQPLGQPLSLHPHGTRGRSGTESASRPPNGARSMFGAAPLSNGSSNANSSSNAATATTTTHGLFPVGFGLNTAANNPFVPSPRQNANPPAVAAPITAPRVGDATFQRTIDDIAGRMNFLHAEFARSQVEARQAQQGQSRQANALQSPVLPYHPTQRNAYHHPVQVQQQQIQWQLAPSTHTTPMYAEPNANVAVAVPPAVYAPEHRRQLSHREQREREQQQQNNMQVDENEPPRGSGGGGGKENAGIYDGGKSGGCAKMDSSFDSEEMEIIDGLGFKEVGNMGAVYAGMPQGQWAANGRKAKPTPLDLHTTNINLTPRSAFSDILGSPPLTGTTAASLLNSPVGEFKGWFSNLFNWKTQSVSLHSSLSPSATRAEVKRLLESFGIGVELVLGDSGTSSGGIQGGGGAGGGGGWLKCRVEDAYDSNSGGLLRKYVKFRVEFHRPGYGPISSSSNAPTPNPNHNHGHTFSSRGSGGGDDSPMMSPPLSASSGYSSRSGYGGSGLQGGGGGGECQCAIVLVHEKGAASTFRLVFQKVREEWMMGVGGVGAAGGDEGGMYSPGPQTLSLGVGADGVRAWA